VTAEEPLLTSREVAERLGLSWRWVLERFERGEIPGFKFGGKSGPVRFRWSEIEVWLDEHRRGPVPRRKSS
jgi:excisionase family DNA binding protein